MFRTTLQRTVPCIRLVVTSGQSRPNSNVPPSKLEVFIDDKKVHVDPGTTVLQVKIILINSIKYIINY